MSVRTKKRHTEERSVLLRFKGPFARRGQAVEALKDLGFKEEEETVPWRVAFEELGDDDLSGTALAGARHRVGLTQRALSGKCGIPQRHISEMENGKRPIGKKNARLLAKALNVDYRILM